MDAQKLKDILAEHKRFSFSGGTEGMLANLQDQDLYGAKLANAYLVGARMTGVDLGGADLTGADLRHAHLTSADLRHANLTRADLRWSSLHRANLSGATFKDANLRGTNMIYAVCSGTDLTGANLRGTLFKDTDVSQASANAWPIVRLKVGDPRGYEAWLIGGKIKVGCQFFTVREALEHWGPAYMGDRLIADLYIKALEAL